MKAIWGKPKSKINFSHEADGIVKEILGKNVNKSLEKILSNNFLRRNILKKADKTLKKSILANTKYPNLVQEDKYYMASSMMQAVNKAYENAKKAPKVRKAIVKTFTTNIYLKNKEDSIQNFQERFGRIPPSFLTISPGKYCNLACTGCYANSSSATSETLKWDVLDRIITEKTDLWASYFTVISGGEPLLYQNMGKSIFDLARKHPENYFLMFTNGTLINEKIAKEMADIGNITPALSVEGFKSETDSRRGTGIHNKITEAMGYLRDAGVPFGISITATCKNGDLIVSDSLMDYYIKECGAIYAWIFQLMPIGRADSLDMMVEPEQRVRMFKQMQHLIRDKKYFIADFWNSGCVSNGCISAGQKSGYLYIDWNGNVTPCVFNPYSPVNIYEIYQKGGNLNDVLNEPFFVSIREWQEEYVLNRKPEEMGNCLTPCIIKDHYDVMSKLLKKHNPKPIDKAAKEALYDLSYQKGLEEYGKNIGEVTDKIWTEKYLR
jgi:MoaA/NifB/PqqE/SkfB family radical SAM enzyme